MEKKMEIGAYSLGLWGGVCILQYTPIMENQMEKKVENDVETGGISGYIL